MLSKELIRKVRRIQIKTSRLVNDLLAGEYHSTFKGRGMEFDEVREYQPGDEVRTIDWNVTARTGRPFIKKYVEERELTVMLLVDMSASGSFGSNLRLKRELAAELCSAVAFSAIRNNDKVGLILFTDEVERFVPPKKGKRHVLRVISEVMGFTPRKSGTRLKAALDFLGSVTRRKCVAFLISDFLDHGYERALEVTNRRHDLVAVRIEDPLEVEWRNVGLIELKDAETGERLVVDTANRKVRESFAQKSREQRLATEKTLRGAEVDLISLKTHEEYWEPLMRFFKMREHRR